MEEKKEKERKKKKFLLINNEYIYHLVWCAKLKALLDELQTVCSNGVECIKIKEKKII